MNIKLIKNYKGDELHSSSKPPENFEVLGKIKTKNKTGVLCLTPIGLYTLFSCGETSSINQEKVKNIIFILKIKEKYKLKNKNLAKICGVKEDSVNKWLNGKNSPSLTVKKLLKMLPYMQKCQECGILYDAENGELDFCNDCF